MPLPEGEGAPTLYRHYKGGLYELVCMATLESDLSEMVIYRASNGSIWARPKAVFFETVEVGGQTVPRFVAVDPAVDAAAT